MSLKGTRRVLPVLAATLGCTVAAPSAQATTVSCGDVITTSTRVDNDLVGCPGPNALVVKGTGVRLDLNSKELIGAGTGTGIAVDATSSDVTISNGRVSGFATGVQIDGAQTHVAALGLDHNSGYGLYTLGAETSIVDSYFDRNGTGIQIGETDRPSRLFANDSSVEDTTIMRSAGAGILVIQSARTRIVKNTLGQNGIGIRGLNAINAVVDRNYVADNDGDGIVTRVWDGTVFTKNQTLRNGGYGFAISDSYVDVIGNTSSNNARDGFIYGENGGTPQATRFGDNRANDNGGWGFELNVNTTDLGGNTAKRNALGAFNTIHP